MCVSIRQRRKPWNRCFKTYWDIWSVFRALHSSTARRPPHPDERQHKFRLSPAFMSGISSPHLNLSSSVESTQLCKSRPAFSFTSPWGCLHISGSCEVVSCSWPWQVLSVQGTLVLWHSPVMTWLFAKNYLLLQINCASIFLPVATFLNTLSLMSHRDSFKSPAIQVDFAPNVSALQLK